MSDITLNLNGENLVVTDRDMLELHAVAQLPGWEIVKRLLRGMEAGTRRNLEDPETPIEQIRALQGRLSVVTDVADLLDKGVLQWVEAQRKD